jgi:hypothetical protein
MALTCARWQWAKTVSAIPQDGTIDMIPQLKKETKSTDICDEFSEKRGRFASLKVTICMGEDL